MNPSLKISTDFDDNFPPALLDSLEQERAERRKDRRCNVVVYVAVIIAALIVAWFGVSAARAGTVTVSDGNKAQQICDAAAPGDTVNFNNAVLSSTVILRKPLLITGQAKSSTNVYAFRPAANGIVFDGFVFEGNLWSSFEPFHPDGLIVRNCSLVGREGTTGAPGVQNWALMAWTSQGAPTNAKITNNDIGPVESWTAIFGYGGKNIEIAWNEFHDRQTRNRPEVQGRFIKLFGEGKDNGNGILEGRDNSDKLWSGGLWIHHDSFLRWRGMAIENQDGWNGNIYEDLYFQNPLPFGTSREANLDNWICSIVETRSVNMKSRRNYYDARMPAGTPIVCFRVVEELGGFNFESTDNVVYLNGPNIGPDNSSNVSFAVNGTNCSGYLHKNRLVNAPGPIGSNLTSRVRQEDNTPNTVLSWDVNRPRPTTKGPATTQPASTFTLAVAVQPNNTSARLVWATQPSGSYTVQSKTTQGGDDWKPLGTTSEASVTVSGLHSGWEYSFRVLAGNVASATASARIGDISLSTVDMPNNPSIGAVVEPPTTQYVDDPVVKVETTITQKSGKQTKTTATP